jgi:hypothetical protein
MTSLHQISLFEPQGFELAKLASSHYASAAKFFKHAENLAIRGFQASSNFYQSLAVDAEQMAIICDDALTLEILGEVEALQSTAAVAS